MKTIIAGSRSIKSYTSVCEAIRASGIFIVEVVSGGAAGVDALGIRWSKENQTDLVVFHANWNRHGKKAGPMRNLRMAAYADSLIAVWDGKSRGTKNMITCARNFGLSTHVHFVGEDQDYA